MTLGLAKLHPWRTGALCTLLRRFIDLVKNTAVAEMIGASLRPSPKNRIVNRDERQLWEGIDQRLVRNKVGFGRPIVVLGGERLPFGRIEIFEVFGRDVAR